MFANMVEAACNGIGEGDWLSSVNVAAAPCVGGAAGCPAPAPGSPPLEGRPGAGFPNCAAGFS